MGRRVRGHSDYNSECDGRPAKSPEFSTLRSGGARTSDRRDSTSSMRQPRESSHHGHSFAVSRTGSARARHGREVRGTKYVRPAEIFGELHYRECAPDGISWEVIETTRAACDDRADHRRSITGFRPSVCPSPWRGEIFANSVIFSQQDFNLTGNRQFDLGLRLDNLRKFHRKGNSTCAIYPSRLS